MDFIPRSIFLLKLIPAEKVGLHIIFSIAKNKKRLLQRVLVVLTLGLAYENDILKEIHFLIGLKTFTEEERYNIVRITGCTPYDLKC